MSTIFEENTIKTHNDDEFFDFVMTLIERGYSLIDVTIEFPLITRDEIVSCFMKRGINLETEV